MLLPILLGSLATATGIASSAATTALSATATGLALSSTFGMVALGASSMFRLTKTTFNTVEVMQILGLSKPTVLKKLKNKELNYKGNGGKGGYEISQKDIEEYARKHKIEPNWSNFIRKEPTKEELEKEINAWADIENNPDMLESLIKIIEADKKELELYLKILDLDDDVEKATRAHQKEYIETEQKINNLERIINLYKIHLLKLKATKR